MSKLTETLIDVAQMQHIINYLNTDSELLFIVDVKDEDLAEVADLCLDDGSDIDRAQQRAQQYESLIRCGKMDIVADRSLVDLKIPWQNAVHCVRLKEIYLVKDLKKEFAPPDKHYL